MPPRFFRNQRVVYFFRDCNPSDGGEIGWHGVVADFFKRTEWIYVIHFPGSNRVAYAREEDLFAVPGEWPIGQLTGKLRADHNDDWVQQPFGLLLLQPEIAVDNQAISGVCHFPGCRWATVRFEKSAEPRFAFQLRAAATDDPDYAARIDVSTPANSVLNRAVVLETLSCFLSVKDWREV